MCVCVCVCWRWRREWEILCLFVEYQVLLFGFVCVYVCVFNFPAVKELTHSRKPSKLPRDRNSAGI